MAKISFLLVFSIVLALPFRSVVIGQDWNELVSQAGLTEQTLGEAKKAISAANGIADAAAGKEALNDYLGGGSEDVAEAGASLADLIDNDGNNIVDAESDDDVDAVSPSPTKIVDPPADKIGEMLDAQETPDDAPTSSPSEAPRNAPSKAPAANAPSRAPAAAANAPKTNAPSRAPAANAPIKTPILAPIDEATEAPEDADEVMDEDDPDY